MSRTFYQFSFLYQTKKNEHEIYTDNPSGSFDLQRLIAGKPAWKQIRYANHLVKKRLVIYDWTFFNYTEIQAEDFYQLIDDLMTEQFEIYFWTSKSIELITSKNWYVYRGDPNKKILKWSQDYAHLAEVKKCIVNDCSWTEDEFFILDDYWLQVLQNTSYELPRRQLFISNLAPHPQAGKILLGASSLIPKVERVVADEISSNAINFFSKMERFIKSLNLNIAIHYQKLKLDNSDLNNLLNNDILPIADRIITKLDLADIEAIDFNEMNNAYLDTNELNKLFALTPHLKRINNLTYAENGVLLNPVPDLESLNISCGELPYKLWGDALKMRYLKSIFGFGSEVLSDLKNINSLIAMEDYEISLPDLSHLNKLKALEYLCEYPANLPKDLVRLELSYVDFNVIKSLRNLKELMVLENVPLPRHHDQIPSLEILRLTLLKLSEAAEVDRVFPNLKILEMSQITSDSDVKNLNITLNNIESLIISDKSSSKDIVCLIQNAPKLKKLSCHSLNYSPEEFANRSIYLPQLQHFTYSGDKDLFYSILENAPKLKFVKLEHFNKGLNNVFSLPSKTIWTTKFFIKDKLSNDLLYELLDIIKAKHLSITLEYQCNFLLENLPLASELQSLEIIGWVSNKLLNQLLYQTPRLKKLKISHTQSSDSIKLASNLFLPNLEEVILCKTPFSLENLDFLAKVAPNIKTLSISTLPLGVMVLHSSLNKLEQLTIEGAYLTVQNIQTLLIMCPNLVKLSLIGLQLADARIIDNVYESMVSNLNLTGSSINNTQLIQLLSLFPKLNNLSLIHCKKVVLNSISPFLKKIPIVDLKGIHSLPFRPQKKEDVQWCDFNTALPKEKLSAKRYFYSLSPGIDDPEIKFYRLKVFHELKIHANGTDPNHLVELIKSNDPQWRMLDNLKQHRIEGFINYAKQQAEMDREHYHYYGQVNFELTSAWQKLPSISPLEKLTDLAFAVEIPFEVRYSDRDNLYYLRALEGTATSHIHYIVRVPRVYPKLTMAQKFQQDINYLLQFQASGFNNIPQNLTGEGYLNLLWMLQVGACRHRSMLFLWRHAQDVRVIYNDCHAFIEVKVQGRWLKVDLGGYPAALEIIEEFISPAVSQNLNQAPQPQLVADTHMAKYASRLEPWRTQSKNWSSWEELRDDVLHQGQKILFEVNSPAEVNAVWANLSHYCHQANRHYFFIDNPDDLHCTLPYLAARSNSYQIQPGPGGLLFDFFQTCTNTALPALLIINYERFGVEDLIRTNSILDPERQIEGVLLPPSLSIVGIRNRMRSDVYEGADFISRWQRRVHIPANLTVTTVHLKTTNQSASCTLDLWDDAEAYELLLGRWRMMGAGFIYEEGLLVSAVAAGHRVIALRQAPLEVRTLCHQISTLGWIAHHGKRLEFPQGLQFQWTWGYDWQRLRNAITWLTAPKPRAYVLNPGHLPTFFSRYIDDPMKQNIQATSGWVKDAAGQLLPVTLSRSLTEGQWAQLLHYCLLHEVKLEVFCPQSVSVPEVLGLRPESQEPELIPNLRVIVSTERDSTVLNLLEQHPQARFADITECTSSDLWQHWHTRLDTEEYRFRIWHQPGWLQQALMGGETVILTGTFSADLQDALQTVWCGPNQAAWSGQLFLVTEHDNDFPLFAHQQHLVVVEEKKVRLLTRFSATLCAHLTAEQWSQESLSQLQARLRFLQRVPQGDSHDAWHGLQSLKPKWDDDAQADTVLAQRKAALEAVWATSPYVCIVGLTGGGKTTFISKILANAQNIVYYGEAQQAAWAQATGMQRHILCLDEGNLSTRQRSELEGLCFGALGMPWGPNYYTLTSRHKVVVLMNPQAEGGLRQLPSLFLRHGNTLIFDPLPPAFVAKEVITPLLGEVPEVAAAFLVVYRFACQHSTTRILMTPRDIAMMAALYLAYSPRPHERQLVAQYVAYQIGRSVLPKALHDDLLKQLSPLPHPLGLEYLAGNDLADYGFILTPSRLQLVVQLQELFFIRHLRQQQPSWQSKGLGGLLVESAPGLGKSELIRAFVHSQGMVLWNPQEQNQASENAYMIIPASLSPMEKKNWLLQAFHAGAVVIMDEINSGPVVEDLLNSLLCGETPDKEPPKRAGFLLLATQNPSSMPGRVRHTSAIERRLLHVTLGEYPKHEVEQILRAQGLNEEHAQELSIIFQQKREEGQARGYAALPTLRDVLILAQETRSRKRLAESAPEEAWHLRKKSRQFGLFHKAEDRTEPIQRNSGCGLNKNV